MFEEKGCKQKIYQLNTFDFMWCLIYLLFKLKDISYDSLTRHWIRFSLFKLKDIVW